MGGKFSVHVRDSPPPWPSPARRGGNVPVIQKHYTSVVLHRVWNLCASVAEKLLPSLAGEGGDGGMFSVHVRDSPPS
jgi:hypothetical protein